MAAVLEAFASKLVGMLADMAKEEVEKMLGVPGEITKLQTMLSDLSCILADAERKRIRDAAVERWVRELKDIMYDADDILDLCQIMEGEGEGEGAAKRPRTAAGFWNISRMFSFRNHEIGKKIQALNQRLEDTAKRSSRFGFISQVISTSSSRYDSLHVDMSRKTGPAIIKSDVVGEKIERDTRSLVNLLTKKDHVAGSESTNNIAVVAITGTGGIGKTTLAKMVFNDNTVQENFDERIWLCVNQDTDEIAVLCSVIAQLGSNQGGAYGGFAGDKAMLECELMRVVKHKKFLLVMDDVWSEKVWNELLRAPLHDGAPDSCILVTTRNDGVAHGMKAQYIHHVDKLNSRDAWSLLKKQVILNESDKANVDILEDIGMNIVGRCDGLPLAIKVVGGLLINKSKTRGAWMDVSNHFVWSLIGIREEINHVVYLSYEELPSHLKQCFLYCSLFPKAVLNSKTIVQMWIAEDFVKDNTNSRSPEVLGYEYYKELISRNLLEPYYAYYDNLGCTMHDVIRSFAQNVAKEEGLLDSGGQNLSNNLGTSKLRRLSISNKKVEWSDLQKHVSLRTLILFQCPMVELKDLWNNLSHLRILQLYYVDLDELPDFLCQLKHLRYLGLQGTDISTIPQDIGNLKFLQHIDLMGCANLSQLPNSITKLQKLRSLDIRGTGISSMPRDFGKLESLVEMRGFQIHSDDSINGWCSLEELGSLSKLRLLYIEGLEEASSGSMAATAELSSKHHLVRLSLGFTSKLRENGEVKEDISKEEQERIEEVLGDLRPPPFIENFTIEGYFGHQLPHWMAVMPAFENLRRLDLIDFACCKQLPSGLGQLPFLDYLWIKRAPSIECIRNDFLLPPLRGDGDDKDNTPATTVTRIDKGLYHLSQGARVAFPKLDSLGFDGMLECRGWDWEDQIQAMPILDKLAIRNCKLSHLPSGLAYQARLLRNMILSNVSRLVSVENFPSLVDLMLSNNPKLERITKNPSLQRITIIRCPALKILTDLPTLRTVSWEDLQAERLPQYFEETKLNNLHLSCSLSLLKLISLQDASSEWGKIQHVQQVKAYARKLPSRTDEGSVFYTKEPYCFKKNINETQHIQSQR